MASPLVLPRASWDQGDFVEGVYFSALDKPMLGVLLTPACDIELGKVSLWTFVALFEDVEVAAALKNENIENLVRQKLPRYQWFPPLDGVLPAMVADFANVSSIPVAEAKKKRRVASLNSSWREQIPARFVAFMGRVGTEDLSEKELKAHIDRLKETLKSSKT
jgi:hypothetical protein